jgi:hypothetical protein
MVATIQELLNGLTPEMYQKLKLAIEIGKWPTGGMVSKEQRELCMQALIAYEKKHLPKEQHSGYIPPKEHNHCGSTEGAVAEDEKQPLAFKESI